MWKNTHRLIICLTTVEYRLEMSLLHCVEFIFADLINLLLLWIIYFASSCLYWIVWFHHDFSHHFHIIFNNFKAQLKNHGFDCDSMIFLSMLKKQIRRKTTYSELNFSTIGNKIDIRVTYLSKKAKQYNHTLREWV